MANDMMRWLILGIAILLFFSMQGTIPSKTSVASVNNSICAASSDCVCWGKYNYTSISDPNAYGIGKGNCVNGRCDMTWCYDIQPIGQWAKDNPWQWMKDNPMLVFGIIGLLILFIFWNQIILGQPLIKKRQ